MTGMIYGFLLPHPVCTTDQTFRRLPVVCYSIIFTIMGIITIEIPQNINRKYRLVSEKSAKEVLEKIEKLVQKENLIDDEDILGLWSDRKEAKIKNQ